MRAMDIDVWALCLLLAAGGCGGSPRAGGEQDVTRNEGQSAVVKERDITLPASRRGPALGGTLAGPAEGCPCPTAILLPGIGSHDRDYTIFGHKLFAPLAEELARSRIASLRFDERGVGESGGQPGVATPADLSEDVAAWMALLREQPEVNGEPIGIVGHSEGGIVAALAARGSSSAAFLVLVGTPGLGGFDYNLQYEASVARVMGADEASIRARTDFQSRVLTLLLNETDRKKAEAGLRSLYSQLEPPPPPEQVQRGIDHLLSPRFIFDLKYDPASTLAAVAIPVLAVFGAKDVQVPPERNADAMRSILGVDSGRDRVVVLPGLNHFMQTAPTGSPEEYPRLKEAMAPAAVELITQWIQTHTGLRKVGPS